MNTTRAERGFTLLELLMVVIIIAILAAIALPQYLRATEKSRASEALQILGAVRSAETRYRAQDPNSLYTTVVTDLDIDFPAAMTSWTFPVVAAPGGGVGRAEMSRTGAGTYAGQIVGITFGSGTICGTFVPLTPMPACFDD